MSCNQAIKKTTRKRKKADAAQRELSLEEKIRLAELIRNQPRIWNLSDPLHKRQDAVASAWKDIAEAMELPVSDCKNKWKSLKDAFRYHKKSKKGKPKKSGDSASENDEEELEDEPQRLVDTLESWPMYEHLRFLEEKPVVSTLKSQSIEIVEVIVENPEAESCTSSSGKPKSDTDSKPAISSFQSSCTPAAKSNYGYMINKRRKDDADTSKLISGLQEFIEVRKQESQLSSSADNDKLHYHSMYANLDRILKKLPEEQVEELNMDFMNLAYNKLKEFTNT